MTEILVKDPLRDSVESASGGAQTVLWTKSGLPSYMTVIPKMRLEDLHPALGTGVHPAFIVNGLEKSEIFIASYQAVIQDGEAISLPGQDPAGNLNFDAARAACFSAGPGFHLLTNQEWAAIALWCAAKGHDVRGNTNCGRSHSHPEEQGKRIGSSYRTLTGSGPASWRHDGTMFGISDLVGNIWEWVDGVKLQSGRIVMPTDNNYSLAEPEWPDTGLCIDFVDGEPVFSEKVTERQWDGGSFRDVSAAPGLDVPLTFKQALLYPIGDVSLSGYYWADNTEDFEALPLRGGSWGFGSYAGLAALSLDYGRSCSDPDLGFRPAFIG